MSRPLDLIIVGAGIAGVIHLHHARRAGLDALLIDRASGVGGLWRTLPAWQDIQISPVDWTVGDLPIDGPLQPQILANIEAWVSRFGLADGIRLNCPALRLHHDGSIWRIDTPAGELQAWHLIAATGGHNRPLVLALTRRGSAVDELHSSALTDVALLRGRDVLVVGGGASALDLLDHALEQGARRVRWVHRGLRWFTPTSTPKAVAGSVRPYSKLQASGATLDQQNALLNADLRGRYERFGLQAIVPAQPLDMRHDQLFPGRPRMIAGFASIERHAGEVRAIDGRDVVLEGGERLQPELLLWGTGYSTDLSAFADPRIAGLTSVAALAARCACLLRSVDAPNLYFPGVGLDGIGATSWAYAMTARTLMSHIRGTAQLDMAVLPHRLNHLDMVRHLAERDPASFAAEGGFEGVRRRVLATPDDQPYPMP